jgi:hypothetical protein
MDVQVIADRSGRLLWPYAPCPVPSDIRAAHEIGIIDALAEAGISCWADKAYRGADGTVRVPCWGRWDTLSTGQQSANRSRA